MRGFQRCRGVWIRTLLFSDSAPVIRSLGNISARRTSHAVANISSVPTLRRDSRAFYFPHTSAECPASLALSTAQPCRKKDLFSPLAWWGDDSARHVNLLLTLLVLTIMLGAIANVSSAARSEDLLRHFPGWMTKCHLLGYLQNR